MPQHTLFSNICFLGRSVLKSTGPSTPRQAPAPSHMLRRLVSRQGPERPGEEGLIRICQRCSETSGSPRQSCPRQGTRLQGPGWRPTQGPVCSSKLLRDRRFKGAEVRRQTVCTLHDSQQNSGSRELSPRRGGSKPRAPSSLRTPAHSLSQQMPTEDLRRAGLPQAPIKTRNAAAGLIPGGPPSQCGRQAVATNPPYLTHATVSRCYRGELLGTGRDAAWRTFWTRSAGPNQEEAAPLQQGRREAARRGREEAPRPSDTGEDTASVRGEGHRQGPRGLRATCRRERPQGPRQEGQGTKRLASRAVGKEKPGAPSCRLRHSPRRAGTAGKARGQGRSAQGGGRRC